MKQLGNLILPDSLQWRDRYRGAPVRQNRLDTLGGQTILLAAPMDGIPITLVADPEVTWLDLATVAAIAAMASQVGASFPLIWDTLHWTVAFRHHDPPAMDLAPIWPNHPRFAGTIKLISF